MHFRRTACSESEAAPFELNGEKGESESEQIRFKYF